MILPRSPCPLPSPDDVSAPLCPSLGRRAASRRLSGALALLAAVRIAEPDDAWIAPYAGLPLRTSMRAAHIARVSA